MKLKCSVPISTYIIGPSLEALNLETRFRHKNYSVTLTFSGEKPISLKEPIYACKVNSISLFIEKIDIDIKESEYPKLVKILTPIVNRVLLNIRNFGKVAHVNEIYPEQQNIEYYLWRWDVQISEDGKIWKRILSDEPWKYFVLSRMSEKSGELLSTVWPDIEEAIQDNLTPLPEQEFITNAEEYFRNRNYRMALLESIICLEIVLNQYLRRHMSINMKIPKIRINNLLSPQVGLTARISALLNLCLHSDDIKKVQFDNILTAIKWRNHIIHKTGHLPEGLTEEMLTQRIGSVMNLVSLLAQRRSQIEVSPEMQKIGRAIAEKHEVPIPNIWLMNRHRVLIEFVFFVITSEFPKAEVLEALAQEASTLLKARDSRFNPNKHLVIRYKSFMDIKARWIRGSLQMAQGIQEKE